MFSCQKLFIVFNNQLSDLVKAAFYQQFAAELDDFAEFSEILFYSVDIKLYNI